MEHSDTHVEFLSRFCGAHCNRETGWHCITCHRNAELTCLSEIHDVAMGLKQALEALGPMAGMGMALPKGFGR